MLSTVLNIIMFEDCRNQWSMSRPLLGLILLNEEVRHVTVSSCYMIPSVDGIWDFVTRQCSLRHCVFRPSCCPTCSFIRL